MGRSDSAEIRVDDPFASSAHARIFSRGDFMYVEDMGSTNGTYLNGRQLRTAERLKVGRRDPHRRQRIPVPGVTLRIVEQVGRTDVGRQRSVNEDSLVLAPPFFAVADGMGGAKAGEVASAMAAERVRGGDRLRRAGPRRSCRASCARPTGASTTWPSRTTRTAAWARP